MAAAKDENSDKAQLVMKIDIADALDRYRGPETAQAA
jgi:hypothetical protein